MALFDSLLEDVRARFNLGDKAEALLAALVALIADRNRGGFTGFFDRLSAAGLSDTTLGRLSRWRSTIST